MFDVYGDVASGLKECLSNMGPWSLGDLTLGIRHVGKRHDKQDISDRLPGPQLDSSTAASTYAFLRREIKFAQAAYSIPDAPAIVAKAELPDADWVLHMFVATAKFRPAFMLVKDDADKLVRVVVRGTNDLNDVITDMAGDAVAIEGGSAHEGMLQAANWLLDEVVPLLAQLPRAEIAGYGLRFSGHSLGAGTAALASYLIKTRPTAATYAPVRAIFPMSKITCFCASPPPVLTLSLAHTTQEYMTTCVLDHDVVSRASLANFEQLRLEVLASGWWNNLVDPVVKSSAFEKVLGTLEATGAHQMIGLLAWEAGAECEAATAGAGGASTSSAQGARGTGSRSNVNFAMDNLHQLVSKPTTEKRAEEKAATGDKIKAYIDNYMDTNRQSTAEYQERWLSKGSALLKLPKGQLVAVGAAAAAAAAAAWWAAKPPSKAKKNEEEPMSSASPAARSSGTPLASTSAKKEGSWMGTVTWVTQVAAAAYAAAGAASSTVSTAGDIAQFINPEDQPKNKPSMAAPACSTPEAQFGADHRNHRSQAAPTPSDHPIGTRVDGAPDLSHLDESISSVRLYAPGRLYHLQRTTKTPEDMEVEEGDEEECVDEEGEKQEEVKKQSNPGWFHRKKQTKAPESFILVRGEPPEARFEFIAVRQTWISDHMLDPMLLALLSAEQREPIPQE